MGNKDEIAKKTNDKKKGYICKKKIRMILRKMRFRRRNIIWRR